MPKQQAATRPLQHGSRSEDGASAQQLFERALAGEPSRRSGRAPIRRVLRGVLRAEAGQAAGSTEVPRHLRGLERAGCVTLHRLRTPTGRRPIDRFIVAPSGIYCVEERPWRGQVAVSGDELYIDGRMRAGLPESVARTTLAAQQALADELAMVGLSVTPVLCLPAAETTARSMTAGGMLVLPGRSLARHLRQAPPVMGPDTVVRLALDAHRLLERDTGRAGG
jgi:hypothetical protein